MPSIKGADEVVLEDGYPAHAQTFLDMRDIGFEDYAAEAVVPGLSTDVSDLFLALYEGKADAQAHARRGRRPRGRQDGQVSSEMTLTTGGAVADRPRHPRIPAPSAPGGLRKESAWRRRDRRWGYVFIGPQVVGMAVFVLLPFVASMVLAFTSWNGLTELTWVGFENFTAQLQDELLLRSIVNTLLIALITVPIGLGLAVVIAVALEKLKTRTLYLILFFAPVVTSTVAVAMIWQQMFRVDGVLSQTIANVFGIAPPDWLGDPKLALLAVCIVSIWSALGLNVIIFLAGLQNISPSVIEAARIDGAGAVAPVPEHPHAAALADHLLLVDRGVHLVAADVRHGLHPHRRRRARQRDPHDRVPHLRPRLREVRVRARRARHP